MEFLKYSASGNDFLIMCSKESDKIFHNTLATRVCDRHNGIGADGLVVLIESSGTYQGKPYAYKWEFYNADGSCATMCGNASRSVGHYAYSMGIAARKHNFLSEAGLIGICIDSKYETLVQSDLGMYRLIQQEIKETNPYGVNLWSLLDTGVPHLVGFIRDKNALPQKSDQLMKELRLRYNANINLAYVDNEKIIYMTYERGVEDITQACGTGAAAVFALALQEGLCAESALLIPPSGEELRLSLDNERHILFQGFVRPIAQCKWLVEDIK